MKRWFTALAVLMAVSVAVPAHAATPSPLPVPIPMGSVKIKPAGPVPVGKVKLKLLSDCYTNSICFYPSVTTWPAGSPYVLNRDAADTPRNTCFAGFGTQNTYAIINNSKYEWWYFRTTTCDGSHLAVDGFNEIQTPDGWHAVHAVMRTSTVN